MKQFCWEASGLYTILLRFPLVSSLFWRAKMPRANQVPKQFLSQAASEWLGGGHLSRNCDLHNYGCAYGLRPQPNVLYSDCSPSQTDCEWIRFEHWHLGTNVANGSIWILTFGNLGTNVANGSIRILTFGYQCCEWIDLNIDIWQFWCHINVRTDSNKTPTPILWNIV